MELITIEDTGWAKDMMMPFVIVEMIQRAEEFLKDIRYEENHLKTIQFSFFAGKPLTITISPHPAFGGIRARDLTEVITFLESLKRLNFDVNDFVIEVSEEDQESDHTKMRRLQSCVIRIESGEAYELGRIVPMVEFDGEKQCFHYNLWELFFNPIGKNDD